MTTTIDDPYYDPDSFSATRIAEQDQLVKRLLAITKPEEVPGPSELADIPQWAREPYATEPEPEP